MRESSLVESFKSLPVDMQESALNVGQAFSDLRDAFRRKKTAGDRESDFVEALIDAAPDNRRRLRDLPSEVRAVAKTLRVVPGGRGKAQA